MIPGSTSAGRRKAAPRTAAPPGRPATAPRPTPIPVSRTLRNLIIAALVGLMAAICWAVPVVVVVVLGGFALAIVLSFPVQLFMRLVPRGLAILISVVLVILALVLALLFLAPTIVDQVGALIRALPGLIRNLEGFTIAVLERLDANGLLPNPPEETAARISSEISTGLSVITENFLGRTVGVVFGTFSFILTLFGVIFVAISLLANGRNFKAGFLRELPRRYRGDGRQLWDQLARTLARYVTGLAFIMAAQGVVTAIGLYLIGIPYPLALGAWTALTAVIPLFGAWIGAVPAILLALSVSPTAVVLTALAYIAIQQLEGNFLTPRIQGESLNLPSIAVFLAVLVGGALAGVMGMLFAVPALAFASVLFGFFRARIRVEEP